MTKLTEFILNAKVTNISKVPGLAAHAAAERAVIAQQSFTGLVGPSGNIGPSGLCGPSGCIQF